MLIIMNWTHLLLFSLFIFSSYSSFINVLFHFQCQFQPLNIFSSAPSIITLFTYTWVTGCQSDMILVGFNYFIKLLCTVLNRYRKKIWPNYPLLLYFFCFSPRVAALNIIEWGMFHLRRVNFLLRVGAP